MHIVVAVYIQLNIVFAHKHIAFQVKQNTPTKKNLGHDLFALAPCQQSSRKISVHHLFTHSLFFAITTNHTEFNRFRRTTNFKSHCIIVFHTSTFVCARASLIRTRASCISKSFGRVCVGALSECHTHCRTAQRQ